MSASSHLLPLLALSLAIAHASCSNEDKCDPADFSEGSRCGPDDGMFQNCVFRDGVYLSEDHDCPFSQPNCLQRQPGVAMCVGDLVGPCMTVGFAGCEDLVTELQCVDNGSGALTLYRGACAPGSVCHAPGATEPNAPRGCHADE